MTTTSTTGRDHPDNHEVAVMPVNDLQSSIAVIGTDDDGRPVLIGSRCRACTQLFFPQAFNCARCASNDVESVPLGSDGILYSYTVVHVSSTRPTPYTLGYVDLEAGPRLLASIHTPADELDVDLPVRLAAASDGRWWFSPTVAQKSGDQ